MTERAFRIAMQRVLEDVETHIKGKEFNQEELLRRITDALIAHNLMRFNKYQVWGKHDATPLDVLEADRLVRATFHLFEAQRASYPMREVCWDIYKASPDSSVPQQDSLEDFWR